MKILFTGGGTLGPVTPLLAVMEAFKKQDKSVDFVWVGTKHGPEQRLIKKLNVRFYSLPKARLPRHFSLEWLLLPITFLSAFLAAIHILHQEKPNVVGSAGGYTAVPIIYAAKFLKIPVWIHQQDVRLLLTNKITASKAKFITVAWEASKKDFSSLTTQVIGNPVRQSVIDGLKKNAQDQFELNKNKPTVLVMGGGSGAKWLNQQMAEIGKKLAGSANVIHLTGRGKMIARLEELHDDYHAVEFLSEGMADVLNAADVIVSRAGMGAITECSALSKACVFVPLVESHQEDNAKALGESVVVLEQKSTTTSVLLKSVLELVGDEKKRKALGSALHNRLRTDCVSEIVQVLKTIAK